MGVRLDQRTAPIAELRARRRVLEMTTGRPIRRRAAPRSRLPRGSELRYRTLLNAILAEIDKGIRDEVLPLVERLSAQVQQQRPDARLDAPADDLEDATRRIRERLTGGQLSPSSLNRIAEEIATDVAGFNRRDLNRVFEASLGVGLPGTEPGVSDLIRGFVRDNIRRIRNIANESIDRVEGSVLRGFRRGRSNAAIAQEVRAELGVSQRRARLIARDQVASLNGELTQLRQTRMGVTEYTWRTAGDERVRPSHEVLDGQRFTWNSPPAEGHPGEPINCRCLAEPVLDELFAGL